MFVFYPAQSGRIFFAKMNSLYQAAQNFNKLLGIKYEIMLGKKGNTILFELTFSKNDFYHLAGLHYLTDIRDLKNDRAKIFDKLLADFDFSEKIVKSDFYARIQERVNHLANLESIIDSNKTVFKYNEKERPFSKIKADFLLKNKEEYENLFLFLAYRNESECFCRSFFPDNRVDYAENQITMSLLKKKKIYILTGEEIVLYEVKPKR
ncbi:PBECR4 domain-containing protein [Treponema sp.]|uniref:PBECR4 domain-containing protein n=1 Tax=Treponema sp. TaxID=166 RepID=UPI00388D616B